MDLLRSRPVSRHEDDGLRTTYECQACLREDEFITDPYDTPDRIRCPHCGYYKEEEDDEL